MSKKGQAPVILGTRFVKDGNAFMPTSDQNLEVFDTLPVGTFTIAQNPMTGALFFKQIDNFSLPPKMYGNALKHASRILNTFNDRPGTTGVLLSGEKGSGKTLLTKYISRAAAELGMPTVVINQPFAGDGFNNFIQSMSQPCILLFDEFEKVYDRDSQEAILTLLDGVFPTKKLFLFTCNDKWRIDAHMTNRPGRIFYHLEYSGLDAEFIREYCEDNLINKRHASAVVTVASTFEQFNFDMLKALVEEMNRYDENPYDALKLLNASPIRSGNGRYDIQLTVGGNTLKQAGNGWPGNTQWSGNPVTQKQFHIAYEAPKPPKAAEGEAKAKVKRVKKDESGYAYEIFTQDHISGVDADKGIFTFTNEKGAILTLTKVVEVGFTYNNLARLDGYYGPEAAHAL